MPGFSRFLLSVAATLLLAGCDPDTTSRSGGEDAEPVSLDPRVLDCLVEVRSERASIGSGFIARWNDAFFVVTNLHVLASSEQIELVRSDGKNIRPIDYFAAANHDIAIVRIAATDTYLEIASTDEVRNAHGKPVIVAGNSLGGGVFTALSGRVLGIGGTRMELDARFVSGNSGSPVFLETNHKVIGVASHTVELELLNRDAQSRFQETRWFGYRLDTVNEWHRFRPRALVQETRRLQHMERRIQDWIAFLEEQESDIPERLRSEIQSLARNYHARRIDGTTWPRQDERLRNGIRSLLLRDTRDLNTQARFYTNREKATELRETRDYLADLLIES